MRFGFHHRGGGFGGHGRTREEGCEGGRRGMRGGGHGRFGRGGFAFGWAMDGDEEGFGRGGHRGGRRMRLFDGGELRFVLLRLIGDQPRHGYDLIRAIEERTGGAYAPSPGVVYPTITMLADMGLIEEQAPEAGTGGAKKLFAVTEEGRRTLEEKAEEITALLARLDAIGEARERSEQVSVRRAIHNLRHVLGNKLGSRELEPETVHEIVSLIDEAARKIERL